MSANKVWPMPHQSTFIKNEDEDEEEGCGSRFWQLSIMRYIDRGMESMLDFIDRFKDQHPTLFDFIAFIGAVAAAALYMLDVVTDIKVAQVRDLP